MLVCCFEVALFLQELLKSMMRMGRKILFLAIIRRECSSVKMADDLRVRGIFRM